MESKDTNKGISSGRFQPGEETFEDVEAHRFHGTARPDDTEDTEGHGFRGNVLPEEADTEGHGIRVKVALPEEPDDENTEGHRRYP